ncbi:hypothetical protein [Streptomyces sp. NPDC003688]
MSNNTPTLDPLIQHPTRLAIVAFLSGCTEAEFSAVRDGKNRSRRPGGG